MFPAKALPACGASLWDVSHRTGLVNAVFYIGEFYYSIDCGFVNGGFTEGIDISAILSFNELII